MKVKVFDLVLETDDPKAPDYLELDIDDIFDLDDDLDYIIIDQTGYKPISYNYEKL